MPEDTQVWPLASVSSRLSQLVCLCSLYSITPHADISEGWLVEKFGRPLLLLFIGCVIFTGSCFLMSLTMVHPIVGCIGMLSVLFYPSSSNDIAFGLCLGLFEPTLYTCLAAVLPEKGSSTAFTFSSLIFQVCCK